MYHETERDNRPILEGSQQSLPKRCCDGSPPYQAREYRSVARRSDGAFAWIKY
jgi:hypothetical protein